MTLSAADVTVRIDDNALVDAAAFEAPAGAVTALLGPNGAGKSTLLRVVAGVLRPASGTVHFDGADLLAMRRRDRARRVALVEQEATTELPLTGRAVVELGRTPHEALLGGHDPSSDEIVTQALTDAGALPFADRELPSLSGGERQRVLLARALAQQPQLLLLDEPMNHLDIAAQLDVLGLLARLASDGVTVLTAMHDLALAASHADYVVVLAGGRVIASGSTAATLTPDLVHDVYGVRAAWTTNPLTEKPLLAIG
ncbi:ATP-binding cassette domain-containing protein [Pseudolysinimonas sp.]|uniref:ABC transporter ATP-binding protein n=1 Tax=Pseudolysinimonas sp. TaxID=2680009 RepID=UPI00286D675D|nr:ATP-binding cassette domain-containing protein [Pseudolysinimonas sp.]